MKWLILSISWLIITISLSIWWIIHGVNQAKELANLKKVYQIQSTEVSERNFDKINRMLIWEGSFFIVMLSIGGGTIITLFYLNHKRNKLLESFFSTITHELKTPLSSLYLQTESLLEDFSEPEIQKSISNLDYDLKRLNSQIEKAFSLASLTRSEGLFFELISLDKFFQNIQKEWNEFEFHISIPTKNLVYVDQKVLQCIFRNLLENSYKHGKAKQIFIQITYNQNFVNIDFKDDGTGFAGNKKKLAAMFFRHTSSSGTGVGLYIVKSLMKQMKGKMNFTELDKGFGISLKFPSYK